MSESSSSSPDSSGSGHIVFGLHAVSAVLAERPEAVAALLTLASRRDRRLRDLVDRAMRQGIAIEEHTSPELKERFGDIRHQGIVGLLRFEAKGPDSSIEDLVAMRAEKPLILVLDQVQDPHNLGACMRCAEAAGARAIVLPRAHSAPVSSITRKVASGAAETLPIVWVTNLAQALEQLGSAGYRIIGAEGQGERCHFELELTGPLVLVLGAEGRGLRRLTKRACHELTRIPMLGRVSSLNVSVAAGILLFEAVRQRAEDD